MRLTDYERLQILNAILEDEALRNLSAGVYLALIRHVDTVLEARP